MGFDAVVGHDRQKDLFLKLLAAENPPQALLLAGQEGIGKKKAALEFVKYMFCEEKRACGLCRSCMNVEKGSHPDLWYVDKDTLKNIQSRKAQEKRSAKEETQETPEGKSGETISIKLIRGDEREGIRGINQEVLEQPYEAEKRAIIIDGAHLMQFEAANALLKTLEESPPYNIFLLITSSERAIPLTIRSRCARIPFSPLAVDALEQYFTSFFRDDSEKGRLFSHISYGSIGCGLFWADQENFTLRRRLAELVAGKERAFTTVTLLSERAGKSLQSSTMYLSFLLSFLRDLYVAAVEKDNSLVVNKDIRDLVDWESADVKWIERSMGKVRETFRMMRYNVSRWLLFESLLMQIMR